MTPKSKRMAQADTEARRLEAEIVPLVNEIEDAAVGDVVEHISGVLDREEKKVETERRTRKMRPETTHLDSKPR